MGKASISHLKSHGRLEGIQNSATLDIAGVCQIQGVVVKLGMVSVTHQAGDFRSYICWHLVKPKGRRSLALALARPRDHDVAQVGEMQVKTSHG